MGVSKQKRARKNYVPKLSREIADFRSVYCGWDNGTMGQIVNKQYQYSLAIRYGDITIS